MKGALIIVQLVMGFSIFLTSFRLKAQAVSGARPNSYYGSFAAEIATAAKQQQQQQRGTVTISGIPKADFSSLGHYNTYPVRRLQLIGAIDNAHGLPGLQVGEATLLIIQPIPYRGSLFVFNVEQHSLNVLVNLSSYEEAFQYGNASSLSFGYFLENEKYLANFALIADSLGHSISFLDPGSGSLTSLPELLQRRYGGIAGLNTRLQQEQDEASAKEEAFLNFDPARDAPVFIRKSWQVRSRFLPHDTVDNIQLLLNDISTTLEVDNHSLQLALPVLLQHLRSSNPDTPPSGYDFTQMILFMGKDITRDLAHVLNADQLKRYGRHLAIWKWQYKAVDIYVYTIYLKGPYRSMEDKKKAYDDYMLSLYKN
jgi:hypothetical protein